MGGWVRLSHLHYRLLHGIVELFAGLGDVRKITQHRHNARGERLRTLFSAPSKCGPSGRRAFDGAAARHAPQ